MNKRRITRKIKVKDVYIGGNAPVLVQSMTNTYTGDVDSTIDQINRLVEAGCELVRCGVPDMDSARALKQIVRSCPIPVCADIHFDPGLAMEAVKQGVHKLRINPGNIGDPQAVARIAEVCRKKHVPIRIGVNAGSLEEKLVQKYGGVCAEAMVESAINHVRLLEKCNFEDIIISLKSSSAPMSIEAYQLISRRCDYPLHLGITEAGTRHFGTVKSSVGIGILLWEGIGDTIRVSLTADPVYEVKVAWDILRSLQMRQRGPELISCPVCARCQVDLESLAREVEERLQRIKYPIKVAVMGCVVNGPGEAKEADVGIAGGKGRGVVFREGEKIEVVDESRLVESLFEQIDVLIKERKSKKIW